MLYLFLVIIAISIALLVYDEYIYKNCKPKYRLEHIETQMERLSREILEAKENPHISQQSLLDVWDFWDAERTRALVWNKNHPDDAV